MSSFDVTSLLAECSPDEPCGPDLEYDDAFSQMERAAAGKPEQQYGDTVIDAEPPEWKEVKSHAIDVVSRSKDIRAAVYLAKATLIEDGLPSFRDALEIIHGYMDRYWETFHPQLDPDDDNDPTIRANTLNGLCQFATLDALRDTSLATARGLGSISYRQIALAKGETTPPEGSDEEILSLAAVNSIFAKADFDNLAAIATAVSESLEHAQAIEASMTEKVGAYDTCNLDALVKELTSIHNFVQTQVSERGPAPSAAESPIGNTSEPTSADNAGAGPAAVQSALAPAFNGEINSREDAIRAIDRVCQYFERHEPSSPLPLLLRRAKRLSTKSFLEILKDVSPDGVSQAEALGGAGDVFEDYSIPADASSVEDSAPSAQAPPRKTQEGY